ncbi:MAG: hypothetical protein QXU11_00290 [Thermoproteota archaeon]
MWPNPSYLFLAAFSAAFAIMMLLYFSPIVETSSVRDLMWLTFLFLMLDAVLSAILAFVKAGSEEKKSK